jgi:hypothetical protein
MYSLEISKFRVLGRIIRILEEGQGAQEFVAPRPLNLKKKMQVRHIKKIAMMPKAPKTQRRAHIIRHHIIRHHTSAVSIRHHTSTSAYVSIREQTYQMALGKLFRNRLHALRNISAMIMYITYSTRKN